MDDEHFMQRCLEFAEKGRGKTGINPLVGAVLVREGNVIAEGWHEAFGADHAEVMLLKRVTLSPSKGDTLYVNLEPCCHQGKTPPCTDAIIRSGVSEVVYGMKDPNPVVAGKGIQILKTAGILVRGSVLRAQCEWLNRGFVSLRTKGRPFITLKQALTHGGKIAHDDGSPLKITSEEQDVWSHTYLRARHDAILIGVGTAHADRPLLTVRKMNKKFDHTFTQPLRLILDPHMRISRNSPLLLQGAVLITSVRAPREFEHPPFHIFTVPVSSDGCFLWEELWKILTRPTSYFHGITSILVEGGRRTWESFERAGMLDAKVSLRSSPRSSDQFHGT